MGSDDIFKREGLIEKREGMISNNQKQTHF